jgi:predicted PurR-regulated permease PerM
MLGLDARAARATWTVLFILLLAAIAYMIRRTLLIFVCALLFAYLLSPLVDLVDRFAARRFPRNLSLALAYVLVIGGLVTLGTVVGLRIADQAARLIDNLPKYLESLQSPSKWPLPAWLEAYREYLVETLRDHLVANAKQVLPFLREAGQQLFSVLGNLIFVILVPIISFFFLKDSMVIRRVILDQFLSDHHRRLVEDIIADVHVLLAHFMRVLLLLCGFTFAAYSIFLAAMGVPYPLLLALVAAVLEFIPIAGPFVAAVSIVLVALSTGSHVFWIVLFLVAYRFLLDYVLTPNIMGVGVQLPPAAVIFGVLAGEQIGGIMGIFLSIPALAILRVVYVRFQKARRMSQPQPVES